MIEKFRAWPWLACVGLQLDNVLNLIKDIALDKNLQDSFNTNTIEKHRNLPWLGCVCTKALLS